MFHSKPMPGRHNVFDLNIKWTTAKRRFCTAVLVTLCAMGVAGSNARSDIVLPAREAVDDAYVRYGDYRWYNYNNDLLQAKAINDDDYVRKSYMRFDISDVVTADVTGAEVGLFVNVSETAGGTSKAYTMTLWGIREAYDSWDETTMTWNGSPGETGDPSSLNTDEAVNLGNFEVPGSDQAITISDNSDLLSFVQDDTDGSLSLAITRVDVDTGNTSFHSSESPEQGVHGPMLGLTIVPEPSTLTALTGGCLACVAMARRRRRSPK